MSDAVERAEKQEEQARLSHDIISKLSELLTAGLGMVCALAWRDAATSLFRHAFGNSAGHVVALFVHALLMTVLAVLMMIWVARTLERVDRMLERREKALEQAQEGEAGSPA